MTTALDTSVVVAALVRAHPEHDRARPCLVRSGTQKAVIAAHALAESWATLTALPLEPRVTGEQAKEMLLRIQKRIAIVSMSEAIYRAAMERCIARGLRSGAIYDALHLVAAESRGATVLLTFNVGDFQRLTDVESPEIRAPS